MANVTVNVLISEPLAVVARMVGVKPGVSLNDFFARAIASGVAKAVDEVRQGDYRPDRISLVDLERAAQAAGVADPEAVQEPSQSRRRTIRRARARRDGMGELEFDV